MLFIKYTEPFLLKNSAKDSPKQAEGDGCNEGFEKKYKEAKKKLLCAIGRYQGKYAEEQIEILLSLEKRMQTKENNWKRYRNPFGI